ncbi:MAG: DUF5118 domain-containing protein, partial [Bacteroidota bacterium]
MKHIFLLIGVILISLPTVGHAQLFKKKKKEVAPVVEKKKEAKKSKYKPYKEIITEEAVSDTGLWDVHKVDDKNYFEISKDVLGQEILVVSRISGFVKNLNFGGAGVKSRPQQVIRWHKMDNKILLRSVSYNSIADE